eukprot:5181070-Amphidinium_carterae.1
MRFCCCNLVVVTSISSFCFHLAIATSRSGAQLLPQYCCQRLKFCTPPGGQHLALEIGVLECDHDCGDAALSGQ